MDDAFERYTDRVTLCDDGVYRWYYDMDMYKNKSMLWMLLRINLFIMLGASLGGAGLVGLVKHDFRDPMVRGILVVGLALLALMSVLYVIGFYIAAAVKRGNYRVHFDMREDGIELVWSPGVKQTFDTGKKVLSLAGNAMGSRRVRGRYRPSLDEVSNLAFSSVVRHKSYPQWDMIDLYVPGGKFQVYVNGTDFEEVERFILEHIRK